jgi:hypothetical protein
MPPATGRYLADTNYENAGDLLEGSLHGQFHVTTGGPGGDMSDTSGAAFDPIFYLHHW